jgi:hypothetical protein
MLHLPFVFGSLRGWSLAHVVLDICLAVFGGFTFFGKTGDCLVVIGLGWFMVW